jgi:hypothetical protein
MMTGNIASMRSAASRYQGLLLALLAALCLGKERGRNRVIIGNHKGLTLVS